MQRRSKRESRPADSARRERRSSIVAARRRPMAERLELALGWDELAAELREGLRRARERGR